MSTIDLFDGRLTLLTGRCADDWRAATAELGCAGVPIRMVTLGHELEDPTEALSTAYGLGKGGAVLVRPDGYVAWAATPGRPADAAELTRIIRAVTGHQMMGKAADLPSGGRYSCRFVEELPTCVGLRWAAWYAVALCPRLACRAPV